MKPATTPHDVDAHRRNVIALTLLILGLAVAMFGTHNLSVREVISTFAF